MTESSRVDVITTNGHAGVFAVRAFAPGAVVLELVGTPRASPDRYSIQVGVDTHLAPPERPDAQGEGAWRFMNHSCDPNARVDVEAGRIVALRSIEPGDEVTFDYNTTEWDMAESFVCRCGTDGCYGIVGGFRHLPRERQQGLIGVAAPHIRVLAGP